MKQMLENKYITICVENLKVNQEEVAVYFTASISSALPQRFLKVDYKMFNPEWELNTLTGKIKANAKKPKFERGNINFIRLYPVLKLKMEGVTDNDILRFCCLHNFNFYDEIMEFVEN